MSQGSEDGPSQAWNAHFHPSPPPQASTRPGLLPPIRTARDGFDYRRPMNSTSQGTDEANFIDLTNDPDTPPRRSSRQTSTTGASNPPRPGLPRFDRNILNDATEVITLDDDDDETQGHGEDPSGSPELMFVRSSVRPRPPQRRRFHPMSVFANYPHLPQPSPSNIAMRTRSYHFGPSGYNPTPSGRGQDLETLIIGDSNELHLDYGLPSFSMGSSSRPDARRREAYKAPSPAPPGFTRTLAEDDVAVCPHCGSELGTGDGKRQEIWVAKPCGHVRDKFLILYVETVHKLTA